MERGAITALAALQDLSARYALSRAQRAQLERLLSMIGRDARAPTAVREPERAVDVHIADALVALELESVRSAGTIADIGAGAGFPGAAVAVAVRGGEVRLVESQSRKCLFLTELLAYAGIPNARVVCERVEEWREGMGQHDVVVARAVAGQAVVLEYAAPLLRLGGTLVDWRGRRAPDQDDAALRAAGELGLERVAVLEVEPFAGAMNRHLHVYVKAEPTPARFPRRPGAAAKRPLGGPQPRSGPLV